jgi:CHAT domain-containing protein
MRIPAASRRRALSSIRSLCLLVALGVWQAGAGSLSAAAEKPASLPSGSLQGRLDQAKALFDRRAYPDALAILEALLPDAEKAGDPAIIARTLYYSGRSYYFQSDYRTALPLLERAREISHSTGDRLFEGEVLRGIGRLHKQQGTYPDGLRACDEAIAIFTELGQTREVGRTWTTVGALRDLMGQFDLALAAYEKAREGLQSVKDDEYYTLFNEIGITYTNLGRYEDALASHTISLEGREKLGDRYFIGISHANIGDAWFSLGQYQRAIEHYERCIELCGTSGDRRSIAVVHGQLAQAWFAVGDARRTLEHAQKELELTRELHLDHMEAVALRHVGKGHALQGDIEEAVSFQEQSLELSRKVGALADEAQTLVALSELRLGLGQAQPAAAFARAAIDVARRTHAPDLDWEARVALARSARSVGDNAEALAQLKASVEIIDSVRGRVRTDSGKIGYFDSRQTVYQELADVLQEQGAVPEALEVAEAARGRAFSDLLVAQRPALKPAAGGSLDEIRVIEARLRAQEAEAGDEAAADLRLVQTRAAGESSLAGKLNALRNEQPELASLIAADPLRVAEIRNIAARLDATLVEYLVTERRLLIWVVQPGGAITSAAVPVGRDTLRDSARSLHEHLNRLTAEDLRQPTVVRDELARFHRWAIAPIATHLPKDPASLVYVVPHDALLLVPFAALVDQRGDYFIRRHTLASAPSTGVLRFTQAKKQRVVSPDRPHLLALADPTAPADAALEALPGARTEVRQLSRHFPSRRRLALMGDQASEANAKRLSAGQTVLHFAVHGLIRDDRPWESALILAPGEGEDGWLRVPEVFGLDLRADLVVLSGCSTGLGKVSGDGIVGLSRGLIYAGAPSVVVSQWDVSDLSTAYLMSRFYAGLAAGRGKAQSLRAAQLATLDRYPHPALWAAFQLMGEPR